MIDENIDYSCDNLNFKYLNLNKYLLKMYEQGIQDINLFLLISLEKEYYEDENLKKIIADLVKLSNNIVLNINGKDIKFKVNKISLDVGDTLNRHNVMYRCNRDYMLKNNLIEEQQIPQHIKKEFEENSYNTSRQQGINWFRNHAIEAINSLLPSNKQINKNFQLTTGITEIFKGNDEVPAIDYICAEHWLKHQKYNRILEIINEIRNLPFSILEKCYNNEAKTFFDRLAKREEILNFVDMFVKYSKDYLIEETVEGALLHRENNDILEFYYHGLEPNHYSVFKTNKAHKNKIIRNYLGNELAGILNVKRITIREKL
jgi:hypothetical protein